MTTSKIRFIAPWFVSALVLVATQFEESTTPQDDSASKAMAGGEEKVVEIHYLEIVTPDLDETCQRLEKVHGVTFSKPVPEFGNARTAALEGGGQISVRAPMRETENPVVRPYLLVEDIASAVETAKAEGGEIAMPPTEIPGRGKFAIYLAGGIQYGLWEVSSVD